MFIKASLLTVLLGLFLYAVSECVKETTRFPQKLFDDVDNDYEADQSPVDETDYHESGGTAMQMCKRKSLYVNLTELLGRKVVAPDQPVDIGVCEGTCLPERLGDSVVVPFYPKTLRHHVVLQAGTRGYGCCTPYKLHSLTMRIENDNHSTLLQKVENTVVEECGCIL
jgi:hypothetical protein